MLFHHVPSRHPDRLGFRCRGLGPRCPPQRREPPL